jgi:tetratricopeptide (TPR) repeat protein
MRRIAKVIFLWHFGGMKFLCVTVLLFAGLLSTARAQQAADDKYIGIYSLIQQADNLAQTGDPGEAVAAFTDAQSRLQQFQKEFPDWNPNIVSFRLDHIADKIAELKNRAGLVASAKKFVQAATNAPATAPPPAGLQLPTELDNLRAQLRVAQAASEIWQAKLKEALAVQPAAVDPRELERAQEKIRRLMKEIDLLNVSRGAVRPTGVVTPWVTNVVTVYVTNNPVGVTNLADVFGKSPGRPVVVTNYVLVPDTNALAMARLDRAAAVRNFNDEHDRAEKLADEIAQLREGSGSTTRRAAPSAELRAENDRPKNALAANGDAPLALQLRQAQALVASLQSEAEVAALEKMALQNKLQQVLAATHSGVNAADYEARLRELSQERDNLIEKLDAVSRQKAGGKSSAAAAQISALNDEVTVLRSRLAVAEAPPVPFTADEQALFQTGVTPPANPDDEKKSIREMPAGTAELVASAQQHFVHQEFDAAAADYLKILDHDQNNGLALANLATIELQQGKLDDAEKHITAALAQSPNDAYNLSTLGYLKFRQGKYDDALNALSRAAQLDPNNPEIQNYLGVTLSRQGQRQAAETALRRAIMLNPNYAPAHNNLAVIYLSQTPPLPELARWHYQKALAAGQPRNPDLEKMLAEKGAPVTP